MQSKNALSGMDVTVFGMITIAWQGNANVVGLIDGKIDGAEKGKVDGRTDGIDGPTLGPTVGIEVGTEVGVSERGSELHVDRPEPAQAGYTQAGVEAKGVVPNEVIPAQFSMMTT